MKILFVCSSNVCRSPYAEFELRKLVNESEILKNNIEWVKSAAVFNRSKEIFPKTKQCLIDDGFSESEIDIFKSCYIKDDYCRFDEADIIIGMTRSHKWLLPKKYRKKFHLISELAFGYYTAMPDPFLTKDMSKYKQYMSVIKLAVEKIAKGLEEEFSKINKA